MSKRITKKDENESSDNRSGDRRKFIGKGNSGYLPESAQEVPEPVSGADGVLGEDSHTVELVLLAVLEFLAADDDEFVVHAFNHTLQKLL